jgi:hypothetical protein
MEGQLFPTSCDGASGARLRLRALSARDNAMSSHQAACVAAASRAHRLHPVDTEGGAQQGEGQVAWSQVSSLFSLFVFY